MVEIIDDQFLNGLYREHCSIMLLNVPNDYSLPQFLPINRNKFTIFFIYHFLHQYHVIFINGSKEILRFL